MEINVEDVRGARLPFLTLPCVVHMVSIRSFLFRLRHCDETVFDSRGVAGYEASVVCIVTHLMLARHLSRYHIVATCV